MSVGDFANQETSVKFYVIGSLVATRDKTHILAHDIAAFANAGDGDGDDDKTTVSAIRRPYGLTGEY